MWQDEAQQFLQSYITNGTIFTGDLVGVNDTSETAVAIVIMSDHGTPEKAVEKYFFIVKRNSVISFYEMDRLPSRT
jgi:hypothetical protein